MRRKKNSLIAPVLVTLAVTSTLLACAGGAATARPQPTAPAQSTYADYYPQNPMAHQIGKTIVGLDGKPLKLRGVNLGGWLLWEGWEFGKGLLLSESTMLDRLQTLVGAADANAFRDQVYANYITEADIARIAQLGFNSVRVPINAKILEDDAQPYVYKQSGWDILDHVLAWCEKYNVYAVLDLHAVPGGQSRLSPSDPSDQLIWKSAEDKNRTVAMWQAIASRYKDRRIIAGYDLINEPLPPAGQDLADLETRIVAAIRQVDRYHMVIVEGGKFSSDFSMFPAPLSGNQAYGFHMYTWFGDNRKKSLTYLKTVSDQQNVPLWAGEFGENTYDMIGTTVQLYEDPANAVNGGWSFWTWKKAPGRYPALVAITLPDDWKKVMDWVNSPSKNQPDHAFVLAAMNQFIQAVRLENTRIDPQMLAALTKNVSKP